MIFAIMLSVLLLFGAVGGFFAYQVVQIHSYKTNAKEFYTTAISAGAKLENVGNDIHKNWNDYIYNRYSVYGSIESAVAAAQRDHASEISLIKASTAVLEDKYQKLLKLPLLKGDEVEEIRDAVKEAYTAYEDLYNCVIDVKGNYRTYTENFSDFDTQASKALRRLTHCWKNKRQIRWKKPKELFRKIGAKRRSSMWQRMQRSAISMK